MKFSITFDIECGETTCASKPGEFCRFFANDLRGGGRCYLFGGLFDEDGWIQRHPDCLEMAEKPSH
jgi:hypothetical protein